MQTARASRVDDVSIGLAEWTRLDFLPRLKQSIFTGSISSYDRTGGNDDGFSGKYSFIRKEGDGLVIADLKGPGVIYRIWTPTPTDDPIEFYFDGETTPRVRMKYRELFDGSQPPFVAPLSGFGSGGFYTYLPLPYKTSCKVLIRAKVVQFYQINYATYPEGTAFESFSPASTVNGSALLDTARNALGSAGKDISSLVAAPGARLQTAKVIRKLESGKTVTLFQSSRGGRTVGLRISPASEVAGKDRAIILRAYWDGDKEPAINCPVGDFFGASWGQPAARSLMVGTSGDTSYCYFPMPFERSARIELVSERTTGEPINIQAEIVVADAPKTKDEGRFYATWRRENPTIKGKPFTFIDTQGRGHVVGVTLQAQGSVPGSTPFFEGDDQATIDGQLAAHGTGSEDFFNGGWYDVPGRWEKRASYPLSGCLDYNRPMARSGAHRLFLTDSYSFHNTIHLAIEHAPEKNDYDADYVGVTYLYSENRPTFDMKLPPAQARAVSDPDRLVFNPGWYTPIHAFSIERGTLTKKFERIGEKMERYISLKGEGTDPFGDHFISFFCDVPASGKYKVSIDSVEGPGQGIVQLFKDEHAVGVRLDLYAARRAKTKLTDMGTLEMKEGQNQVFFKLVGKNPASQALAFDLVTIVLQRVE